MLQKLRRKFVLINMLLVSAVLLIAFTALCVFTYQRLYNESHDAMRRALDREGGKTPPKSEIGGKPFSPPGALTPVFCVLVGADGAVRTVTEDTAVDMSEETLAQAVSLALEGDRDEGVLNALNLRYLLRETAAGTKIAFADRSGEIRSMLSLVITSLLVGLGGLTAFFFISLFLSSWALRPVKRAWEQQRQFVADASHELKTPLTVILANTDILLAHKEESIARQEKWVAYIGDEARRMKGLVDDMLFLAKADAAREPLPALPLSLSDAVWSCLLPFESVAYEQRITLCSDVAPDIQVTGDEGQLKQLVRILLDNACKYAGEKGVVTLTLEREGDKARLMVNNTGAPIPPEHLPRLFERFYRADPSRSRDQGGYGLGLAIAHSITGRHRGRITVDSQEKTGTTFTVWLPLK